MSETVLVRCENGCVIPHDMPLPEGLAKRVAAGEAQVLGPAPVVDKPAAEEGPVVPASGVRSTRVRRVAQRVQADS